MSQVADRVGEHMGSGNVNDVTILTGIVSVFVIIGFCLPFINADFHQTYTGTNTGSFASDLNTATNDQQSSYTSGGFFSWVMNSITTPFKVFFSILSMFFWTFGALPAWLDMLFLIPRVALVFIIIRNIWVGGGG